MHPPAGCPPRTSERGPAECMHASLHRLVSINESLSGEHLGLQKSCGDTAGNHLVGNFQLCKYFHALLSDLVCLASKQISQILADVGCKLCNHLRLLNLGLGGGADARLDVTDGCHSIPGVTVTGHDREKCHESCIFLLLQSSMLCLQGISCSLDCIQDTAASVHALRGVHSVKAEPSMEASKPQG